MNDSCVRCGVLYDYHASTYYACHSYVKPAGRFLKALNRALSKVKR